MVKKLFVYCLVVLLPIQSLAQGIPDLGNHNDLSISVTKAESFGQIFLQALRADNLIYEDWVVQTYVQAILKRLNHKALPINCMVIDVKPANAFAFFGNHIAIQTGLIELANTEGELAAVLAHEMAHLEYKHLQSLYSHHAKQMPINILHIATAILLIKYLPKDDNSMGAVITGLQGLRYQELFNYTRRHEHEADRLGLQTLIKARYSPKSMVKIFGRLGQQNSHQRSDYLSTHPHYHNRMSEMEARMSDSKLQILPETPDFAFIRLRLQHKQADLGTTAVNFVHNGPHKFSMGLYQKFYAAMREGDLLTMNEQWSKLLQRHPDSLVLQLDKFEVMRLNQEKLPPKALNLHNNNLQEYYQGNRQLLDENQFSRVIKNVAPNFGHYLMNSSSLEFALEAYSKQNNLPKVYYIQHLKALSNGKFEQANKFLKLLEALPQQQISPYQIQELKAAVLRQKNFQNKL